jgi:hypothetical protein
MIVTIVLIIIAFFAGVLLAGKVASAWGGLETDLALVKARAAAAENSLHQRISELETRIGSKL